MSVKEDLLHNIKWMAKSWHNWKRTADKNPMFLIYRRQVVEARATLMIACAEYRKWWCCDICHYYEQGGK